tara:strand:+ start:22686 stop:23294 length:609 start_codon:yes stop_codon:yes gene_type:complete
MYYIQSYNKELDLSNYYQLAHERGFYNNNSKEKVIDTWQHMDRWQVWFLYYNDQVVGSIAAHSLEELGVLGDAYRIAARTCTFDDLTGQRKSLRTANTIIAKHQNLTAQLLLPLCVEWAGKDKDLYISSNENDTGTQKYVHRLYCPGLRKVNILEDSVELEYRGAIQSFWRMNVPEFYKQMNEFWWPEAQEALDAYRASNAE